MKLTNTSIYDDDEVRHLVLFGIGAGDHAGVEIHVKRTERTGYCGRAYSSVPRIANVDQDAEYLITMRIGHQVFFPTTNEIWRRKKGKNVKVPYGGKSVPVVTLEDWREGLVYLTAHEFQHIEQYRANSPRSEAECELTAIKALERYRATI